MSVSLYLQRLKDDDYWMFDLSDEIGPETFYFTEDDLREIADCILDALKTRQCVNQETHT